MSTPIRGDAVNSTPEESHADLEATRNAIGSLMLSLQAARLVGDGPLCFHPHAVPVRSIVNGEALAALCPDCDEQLPAHWANPSTSTDDGEARS